MNTLAKIKRFVREGAYAFTDKATTEMRREHIDPDMVEEAILNAPTIAKRIRSSHPITHAKENLYIIIGRTRSGLILYTKGKIVIENGKEILYLLISTKRSLG